jgi:hypothetical protein
VPRPAASIVARVPALPVAVLVLVLALAGAGCGETPGDVLPPPRDGRSGLQLSGLVGGRQIAVSDGLPEVNFNDCDLPDGRDEDLCIVTEDISGELVLVVIENPMVLVEGVTTPVVEGPCRDDRDCDEVTAGVVVDVAIGAGTPRIRAVSGQIQTEVVVPGSRYRGRIDLRLTGGGTLSGAFDLVPRPDELSSSTAAQV